MRKFSLQERLLVEKAKAKNHLVKSNFISRKYWRERLEFIESLLTKMEEEKNTNNLG